MSDFMSLRINGRIYGDWTSISVSKSLDAVCGSFSFDVNDRWQITGRSWPFSPGAECVVGSQDDDIITGYIDTINMDLSANSRTLSITGRDKTADIVDCSAEIEPGVYNNLNLYQLAQQLCNPFGIFVQTTAPLGSKYKQIIIKDGETVFNVLAKYAKQQNILLLTNPVGNLRLENPGRSLSHDELVEGKNIISINANYDYKQRHSSYIVRGNIKTQGSGWDASTVSVKAESFDSEIVRHRPLVIYDESVQNRIEAIKKGRWEANIRAAKSMKFTVTVSSFRQSNGALWQLNTIIPVQVPTLNLDTELLCSSISYGQSATGGSFTTMELIRPDSYINEPVQTVKPQKNTLGWS